MYARALLDGLAQGNPRDTALRAKLDRLTLEQLRTHREALLDVIGTLRHDPLVDWRKRNAQEDESGVKASAEATKELKKIDSKLNGIIESRGPTPLTVSGQVQALIAEATDINNLSQMYIWWMPWC